jgi:hypothetical protein
LREPRCRVFLKGLVVCNENSAPGGGVFEQQLVVGLLREDVDRPDHIPAASEKAVNDGLSDVNVGKDREATGHYRRDRRR